jgi:hypothetical protein
MLVGREEKNPSALARIRIEHDQTEWSYKSHSFPSPQALPASDELLNFVRIVPQACNIK